MGGGSDGGVPKRRSQVDNLIEGSVMVCAELENERSTSERSRESSVACNLLILGNLSACCD